MKSEGRGCVAGHVFPCRRKRKKEDRPVPRPVRNLRSCQGRGCARSAERG